MNCSVCKRKLDNQGRCDVCDAKKCDVCGREHKNVKAGNWVFYCSDNPKCRDTERQKQWDNEIQPSLETGEMPELDTLENFI